MSICWFSGGVHNLLNVNLTADTSGTLDVAAIVSSQGYTMPSNVSSLILTVERGYSANPTGINVVSLRVMPNGHNLSNILDRAKAQVVVGGVVPGVDVVAQDVQMPIYNGVLKFFYALQSTDPTVANKMAIIDLWGYELSSCSFV